MSTIFVPSSITSVPPSTANRGYFAHGIAITVHAPLNTMLDSVNVAPGRTNNVQGPKMEIKELARKSRKIVAGVSAPSAVQSLTLYCISTSP